MSTRVPYGKPVKLLVDYQGYPEGRLVQFQVFRKKGGKEEKVAETYGVTKGEKGKGWWIPKIERKEVLPLEETINYQSEEEKHYFTAKIDNQEVKSEDMVITFPLDIYVEDIDGKPVDEIKYTVTFFSDGSKKKGVFKNGHAKFNNAPPGKFKIELEGYEFVFGIIIDARWEKNKAECGEEIKMIANVKGFEDGTPAKFKIWKKDVNGKMEMIEEIDGEIQEDKVEVVWVYSPEEVEEDLKEKVEEGDGEPEFFFSVEIEGKEARSGILTFTYPLEIYLEDEDGNPLDNVEYTMTLSDNTQRTGKVEEGYVKIEGVPYGVFILTVRGYDFTFKKAV